MKKSIIMMLSLMVTSIYAQMDDAQSSTFVNTSQIVRTATLNELYEHAKILENSGTAAEINANRLAIKNAWMEVNPVVAALYKPIETNGKLPETMENVGINGIHYPEVIKERNLELERPQQTRDWGTDRLLFEGFVDGGVDMEVTNSGDIYISFYQNNIDFGGQFDIIFLYRSIDGGQTFQEWRTTNITSPIRKLQLISIDGTGDQYIATYFVTDSNTFQVTRWNTASGALTGTVIDTAVTDFSVDKNYPVTTSTQRVFATYLKTIGCPEVYSARSTAGAYGFNWVDAVSIDNVCGQQVDFSYGSLGSCYTTYTGGNSGNLLTNVNPNSNDPGSWTTRETLESGATRQSLNPIIKSTRLPFATDKVLVVSSSRLAGTTDNFIGRGYYRQNGGAFSSFNLAPLGPNFTAGHFDAWVRKNNNVETIRFSYVIDVINNASNDFNRVVSFDGNSFSANENPSDISLNVWDGFASAIAETQNNEPCLAFVGTSNTGSFGINLYFDSKTELLSTQDNTINGLTYFPNPTTDVLHINALQNIEDISIYNLLGQKLMQVKPQQEKVSLQISSLNTGMYIMKITSEGKTATYKINKK
ncbi:MAG: hypothetical protein CVU03_00275 [Bacteroidetes bacterium HGW-Bacteroidetes-2]|jgi:hypothetical protein|nr:MAG: hypothetical protein CVU03_00275 [Bacteroidetes bacterium HGW-Bacteroidetes-2]